MCPFRSVHCIKWSVGLKGKTNLFLSSEVMKFRAECCFWSCPPVCLLRLGVFASESVQVPQVSHAEGLSDSSLYSTSDARTGTLSRFDPRVSWITHRSFHSCDYKAQRYTLDNVSVLSSKAFTATENCFWRFLRQFDILNNKIRMSILLLYYSNLVISLFGLCFSGLSWLLILQRTSFYFYFLLFF